METLSTPEVWGGIECTINRVGGRVVDQLQRGRHFEREDDFDRVASLGITTLRYPVSWERTAPRTLDEADWTRTDQGLTRLRDLGVKPIAGLVHHGSGPHWTSLIEESFVDGLAAFAGAAARRYPWVEMWTPVNEPLTTARFSCLYGHWHPHHKDDLLFARALLLECRATVEAMKAIRAVNPWARLVQTEDIARTFATPGMEQEADLENERRWLSLDLLCGKLSPGDPMWQWLRRVGVSHEDLDYFRRNPCPPDIIGVNYYLNSERVLDRDLSRYPADLHGDADHRYADADAVRVAPPEAVGPYARLHEVWARYRLPLAVTEAHHGSTREEQMRWLLEMWSALKALTEDGVPVKAMTVWSLFGAYEWNSLLTRQDSFYEPGAFDVRVSPPRETALANLVRELASGRTPTHPVMATPGWWRRPVRARYGEVDVILGEGAVPPRAEVPVLNELAGARSAPLLLLGGDTRLGGVIKEACDLRGLPYLEAMSADGPAPWAVVDARDAEVDGPSLLRDHPSTVVSERAVEQHLLDPALPLLTFRLATENEKSRPSFETSLVVAATPLFDETDAPCSLFLAPDARAENVQPVADVPADMLVSLALDLLIDDVRGVWRAALPVEQARAGARGRAA